MWSTIFLTFVCCYFAVSLPIIENEGNSNYVRNFIKIQEESAKKSEAEARTSSPSLSIHETTTAHPATTTASPKEVNITNECIKSLYWTCVMPYGVMPFADSNEDNSSNICGLVDLASCVEKHVNESLKCANNINAKRAILGAVERLYEDFIDIALCPDSQDRKNIVESFLRFEELKKEEESHFEREADHEDYHPDAHQDDHHGDDDGDHHGDDDGDHHGDDDDDHHGDDDDDHHDIDPHNDMKSTLGPDFHSRGSVHVRGNPDGITRGNPDGITPDETDDHANLKPPLLDMVDMFTATQNPHDTNIYHEDHQSDKYDTADKDNNWDKYRDTGKDNEDDKWDSYDAFTNDGKDDGEKRWETYGSDKDHELDKNNGKDFDFAKGNQTDIWETKIEKDEKPKGNETDIWENTKDQRSMQIKNFGFIDFARDTAVDENSKVTEGDSGSEEVGTSNLDNFEKEVEQTGKDMVEDMIGLILSFFSSSKTKHTNK